MSRYGDGSAAWLYLWDPTPDGLIADLETYIYEGRIMGMGSFRIDRHVLNWN